jgi:cytochrome c-type biogenesis protein CcmH/NrfG
MKSEAVAFGVAGILFGLIAGWVIGTQQAAQRPMAPAQAVAAPAQPAAAPPPPMLDEAKVTAFTSVADREPDNATPRVQLGKLYFDSERYDEAIKWYAEALKLKPNDVEVSTELGVSYYYTNQPDRALAQFDRSLKLDPKHTKTILHVGIVKAFAKQDLAGAEAAWQEVLQIAPDSPEGQAARRALDSLRAAHPPATGGTAQKPGA